MIRLENVLRALTLHAVPLEGSAQLSEGAIGTTFSFSRSFRTRGVLGPDELAKGKFTLKGDVSKDPQIYATHKGVRVVLPIDPRWVTTLTAFVDLRPPGGIGYFTGLFTLKQVAVAYSIAIGTPIVIGTPPSPLDSLFSSNSS